jgi:DNA mismatch repair protein MutS
MFFDDARTVSKILNLTLTTRGRHLGIEIPLAGFPHHQLENYLSKMIRAGYKVAVCDQTENPKNAKGIVKRDITEIVTAGTALSDEMIEKDSNNYIVCVFRNKNGKCGFAAADVSTGEFAAFDPEDDNKLREAISLFNPSELLMPASDSFSLHSGRYLLTRIDDNRFLSGSSSGIVKNLYGITGLSSLGFRDDDQCIVCAGILVEYLNENLRSGSFSLNRLKKFSDKNVCVIDYRTRRNLELTEPFNSDGDKSNTLFSVMNKTNTSMGARLLKKWILMPLRYKPEINRRLEITEYLVKEWGLRKKISSDLAEMSDIERLAGKISAGKIVPEEFIKLKNSLKIIPGIQSHLSASGSGYLAELQNSFVRNDNIIGFIGSAIADPESPSIKEKRFIKQGFSKDLDELYEIIDKGKDKLLDLSENIKKQLNIPSLKISYNRVFGYYFEVTKKYSSMIPENFIRKQTLVNSERFINSELKEFEEKILTADDKIDDLLKELYAGIKLKAAGYIEEIKTNSAVVAYLDCLCSFAETAEAGKYTRPVFSDSREILIKNGRHPVVEKNMKAGEDYIPNDLTITDDKNILIITGPNMSGKSTYLRQAALIVLLAQTGSFVPADHARIGMADKIFTRVGASDNLSGGESTFLVEMNETANILNNATPDSLVIFDEVGRGTATFDGLSLAWAIVEYIHNEPEINSRTLFATHYHELTEIDRICPGVKNYHATVKEYKDEIIFMRKIVEGGADNSYGIYVAKLAGIPEKVLHRAQVILRNLEENELTPDSKPVIAIDKEKDKTGIQLSLFSMENDELREELRKTDIDNTTPIQALSVLKKLQELL